MQKMTDLMVTETTADPQPRSRSVYGPYYGFNSHQQYVAKSE